MQIHQGGLHCGQIYPAKFIENVAPAGVDLGSRWLYRRCSKSCTSQCSIRCMRAEARTRGYRHHMHMHSRAREVWARGSASGRGGRGGLKTWDATSAPCWRMNSSPRFMICLHSETQHMKIRLCPYLHLNSVSISTYLSIDRPTPPSIQRSVCMSFFLSILLQIYMPQMDMQQARRHTNDLHSEWRSFLRFEKIFVNGLQRLPFILVGGKYLSMNVSG